MIHVCAVTVARSDWSIFLPVLRAIEADPDLRLSLVVGGMHLDPEAGYTVEAVRVENFTIGAEVPVLPEGDSRLDAARAMGRFVTGFAEAFGRVDPDLLLVVGDRYEMHAAVAAALPMTIPVAHLHGGELTEGAMDDSLRHSMTKLSHLHFTSTAEYAKRVIRLGEHPERVFVSGAPGLDTLLSVDRFPVEAMNARYGFDFGRPFVLATYHPVTLDEAGGLDEAREFLSAMERLELPLVFTAPNMDPGSRALRAMLNEFLLRRRDCLLVESFGYQGYATAMELASAMAGNSSSGIIEAASFGLPVVNVGTRQAGRVRGTNVIDTGSTEEAILAGMGTALAPGFKASLAGMANPYGDGRAARRIVDRLKGAPLGPHLLRKRFYDGPVPEPEEPWV